MWKRSSVFQRRMREKYKAVIENLEYDKTWCEYENKISSSCSRGRINILIEHPLIH